MEEATKDLFSVSYAVGHVEMAQRLIDALLTTNLSGAEQHFLTTSGRNMVAQYHLAGSLNSIGGCPEGRAAMANAYRIKSEALSAMTDALVSSARQFTLMGLVWLAHEDVVDYVHGGSHVPFVNVPVLGPLSYDEFFKSLLDLARTLKISKAQKFYTLVLRAEKVREQQSAAVAA
jgi:hypothetical protein